MMEGGVPFVQVLHRWRLDWLAKESLIERHLPHNNQANVDPENKLNGQSWCSLDATASPSRYPC